MYNFYNIITTAFINDTKYYKSFFRFKIYGTVRVEYGNGDTTYLKLFSMDHTMPYQQQCSKENLWRFCEFVLA